MDLEDMDDVFYNMPRNMNRVRSFLKHSKVPVRGHSNTPNLYRTGFNILIAELLSIYARYARYGVFFRPHNTQEIKHWPTVVLMLVQRRRRRCMHGPTSKQAWTSISCLLGIVHPSLPSSQLFSLLLIHLNLLTAKLFNLLSHFIFNVFKRWYLVC